MTDLNQIWQSAPAENSGLDRIVDNRQFIKNKTPGPLAKLRRHLLINATWAILIMLLYGYLFVRFPQPVFRIFMIPVLAGIVYAIYITIQLALQINPFVSATHSLLEELQRSYQNLTRWMWIQNFITKYTLPLTIIAGCMLAAILARGEKAIDILHEPRKMVILITCILVACRLGYWASKRMWQYSFGDWFEKLRDNINELEAKEM